MVALMDFLALSLLQAENTVVHLAQEIALFCDITDMPQTKLGIWLVEMLRVMLFVSTP